MNQNHRNASVAYELPSNINILFRRQHNPFPDNSSSNLSQTNDFINKYKHLNLQFAGGNSNLFNGNNPPGILPAAGHSPHHSLLHYNDGNKLDPIIVSLSIPKNQRSDDDLMPIIEFVSGLKFFNNFSSFPETVKKMAQKLEIQYYLQGSHVFSEGQPGHHFYIILDGEVTITKKKRVLNHMMQFVTENIVLVKLTCGQSFGETALESKDGLRTASAIASKRSTLLLLHRDDYNECLSFFKVYLQRNVTKLLTAELSIFKHCLTSVIQSIAERTVVRLFAVNTELYCSGTRITNLMIIKSGMVKLTKSISTTSYDTCINNIKQNINKRKFVVGSNSSNFSDKSTWNVREPLQPITPKATTRAVVYTTDNILSNERSENHLQGNSPNGTRRIVSAMSKLSSPEKKVALTRHSKMKGDDSDEGTPPGYWIMTRSDEFLSSQKLIRMVTNKTTDITQTQPEFNKRQSIHPTNTNNITKLFQKSMTFNKDNATSDSNSDSSGIIEDEQSIDEEIDEATNSRNSKDGVPKVKRSIGRLVLPSQMVSKKKIIAPDSSSSRLLPSVVNTKHGAGTINRHVNKAGNVEFTVAVLMPGQFLGELALLDPEQVSTITAIAATAVEVYCIDGEVLMSLNLHKDELVMKYLMDEYKFRNPPQVEIKKALRVKYEWEDTKLQIVNELMQLRRK